METPQPLPPAIVEFVANNPHVQALQEKDKIIINKPWGYEDSQFSFSKTDTQEIEELRHLLILPQLDALLHLDSNEAEFIFAFLDPNEKDTADYLDRQFTFHFEGVTYACGFKETSKRLFAVAGKFRRLPSARGIQGAPQLIAFRDSQDLKALTPSGQKYFEGRQPRSFFVKPSIAIKTVPWEKLSRHLNLVMTYFDRRSPQIEFRQAVDQGAVEPFQALRLTEGKFPAELSVRSSDEILLRLIEVVRTTGARFAFIYCFQVFEYAGFYFIDAKSKSAVSRLLRSPSFINCADDRIGELLSILTEVAQNDEVRIRRVVEEYCDPKALWREVQQDRDFFCNDINFDGGFSLPKLIAKDTTEETWCSMWTPKLIDQVTKTRNCLVHARERRESKVITPTAGNDLKIRRLLPLARRMAEQIVLHGDPV